jgi:hypothetical protein
VVFTHPGLDVPIPTFPELLILKACAGNADPLKGTTKNF